MLPRCCLSHKAPLRFSPHLKDGNQFPLTLDAGGDRNQASEKAQPLRDERTRKLKEILTAEQFGKYEKAQEERRSRMGGGKKKTDQ